MDICRGHLSFSYGSEVGYLLLHRFHTGPILAAIYIWPQYEYIIDNSIKDRSAIPSGPARLNEDLAES